MESKDEWSVVTRRPRDYSIEILGVNHVKHGAVCSNCWMLASWLLANRVDRSGAHHDLQVKRARCGACGRSRLSPTHKDWGIKCNQQTEAHEWTLDKAIVSEADRETMRKPHLKVTDTVD